MRDTSIFGKFSHFLLLSLHFLFSLLLFKLALLLWIQRSQLCFIFKPVLSLLFKLFFFNLVILLFILNSIDFLPNPLSLGAILLVKLQPDRLVEHLEDCLEDPECVLLLFLRLADQDLCPQEARVLVIDLLIGDVAFHEAVTVLVKNIANIFVDDLISCFFTFCQDY